MEDLISQYGYAVVFVGTLLEGETIFLIAAYLTHAGYLSIEYVFLTGLAGTFFGDQFYFFVGRRWGRAFLARRLSWRTKLDKAFGLLERHETLFILSFRFIYGLRNVSPFAIGMSDVRTWKFIALNFLSAVLWASVFGAAGYFAGKAIHSVIGKIEAAEIYVVAAIAIAGALLWGLFLYRGRRGRTGNG